MFILFFILYTCSYFLSHPRPLEEGQCSEIFQDSGKMFMIFNDCIYTENSRAKQGI